MTGPDLKKGTEMKVDSDYDPEDYAGEGKYALIPEADYEGSITNVEEKETKDGRGVYDSVEVTIEDDDCKGRKVWTNLNLVHKNKQTVETAKRELAMILRSTGLTKCHDTQELIGLDVNVRVGIKPAKSGFQATNFVKTWYPRQ